MVKNLDDALLFIRIKKKERRSHASIRHLACCALPQILVAWVERSDTRENCLCEFGAAHIFESQKSELKLIYC